MSPKAPPAPESASQAPPTIEPKLKTASAVEPIPIEPLTLELPKEEVEEPKEETKEEKLAKEEALKAKFRREIKEKHYTNSWATIFSILMFFASFFLTYFNAKNDLGIAFIKSFFILIVSYVIARILVAIWHVSIPREQWMILVHGPQEVDSRQVKIRKEREREAQIALETLEALEAMKAKNKEDIGEEVILD